MSSESYSIRDKFMAHNINWILNHEGINHKIMLWAHNGHVNKSFFEHGPKAMGHYLAESYGDQYYSIGFDFNKGSFLAKSKDGLKVHKVTGAKPKTSSFLFSKCHENIFFIDLKTASYNQELNSFLSKKIKSRGVGSTFYPKNDGYIKGKLLTKYDGLIFINETTSSVPIKRPAGGFKKSIPVKKKKEEQVKFSLMIKCDSISSGKIWMTMKNKNKAPSYKFFEIKGTQNNWQEYIVEQMIEPETQKIQIGFVANGGGKFYIDDVKLYFESSEFEELNSSFENDTLDSKPEYWFVFDTDYQLAVTNEEKYSGDKSLLVKFLDK